METYLYKARVIGSNKTVTAEGKFESKSQAQKYLIDNKMVPLSVDKKTAMTMDLQELKFFQPKIKTMDIAFFCRQFGVMLGAGISIGGALDILGQQTENPTLTRKIKEIDKDVQKGSSLSDAMGQHKEFPNLMVSMIKSGEATGSMDVIMGKLAIHYEKDMKLKRMIKQALSYPILVLIAIAILIPVLMIFVVPGFVEMFEGTGVELPLPTRVVMIISGWMQANWLIMLVIVAAAVFGFMLFKKSESGKKILDNIALKVPLFGALNKKSITALFSETLSLLVTSGVPVFQSLEIVKGVLQNEVAKDEMDETLSSVREGKTISQSMKDTEIYPMMMLSMLNIGEETGALDEMLVKTAEYYNVEVEAAVENLTTMIEPALLLIVGVLVGGIMLAVMLPTFTMATEMM